MTRVLTGLFAALLATLALSAPASAHGHVFVGLGFGFPGYYYPPPYYYAPAYYPPAYYYPPPAAYYPPAYAPDQQQQPSAPSSQCRQYNGDATIDGANQPFYGTACLGADGRWHIVNQ